MMLESGAEPCVECGTTGGAQHPSHGRPARIKGRCATCYERGRLTGAFPHLIGRCLSCDATRPIKARQLCRPCYGRALTQGIATNYPACGTVPVPFLPVGGNNWPSQPKPWPHLNDVAATGRMLWTDTEGHRLPHAISRWLVDLVQDGPDRYAPTREHNTAIEQRAARWLKDRPHAPLLEWPDPRLSLFGAANSAERAA